MDDSTNTVYPATPTDLPVPEEPQVIDAGDEAALLEDGEPSTGLPAPDDVELPAGDDTEEEQEESDEDQASTKATDNPMAMTALQGLINRQSSKLDELREESKKLSDSLKSIIENDQELSQIEEQAKEVVKQQKERRQSLANSAESMQFKVKLKELKESMKDLEESLNNHLLNFYQMTGVKFFDSDDGTQREFDIRAKLRGKKKQA